MILVFQLSFPIRSFALSLTNIRFFSGLLSLIAMIYFILQENMYMNMTYQDYGIIQCGIDVKNLVN